MQRIIIASNLLILFCPFFCQKFMEKMRQKGKQRWPQKRECHCFRRDGGGVKDGGEAAAAIEGGIIMVSLVYILCLIYSVLFGSFLLSTV